MRRVRELLKLRLEAGLAVSEAARRTGMARSTLREMLQRFEASGLPWPLPLELTDKELETRLYGDSGLRTGARRRPEPDWAALNRELKRKHVTLQILWDEYIEAHPDGYRYSRFCELYRSWEARLPVTMRQTHLGGDKLFVDYAGDTVPVIIDRRSGKTQKAHIFVAVMGGSSLSFAYATWGEKLPDWIDGHVQAFEYFGGVPRLLVPDNPKVAIIKACFYEPQANRTYSDLAAHYDTALLPARPRRPRDKAKVEACVRIVERWLLGRLRHRRFYNLAEINAAIAELLVTLNDHRVLRYVSRTRRQLFEELDAPRLKPLPTTPYQLAEWRVRRVGLDYHVEVEKHFYSVPYRHARETVEARMTSRSVEIFLRGERIAVHLRGSGDGKHTTLNEHMPSSHRRYADWTIEKILSHAQSHGPSVALLCQLVLEHRPHPEQGFRSCMGIVRLAKTVGPARLEAACERALLVGARSYGQVKSILDNRLDGQPVRRRKDEAETPVAHGNIRGSKYYH
ncbi:IS21 family transposase [Brevundimonas aurantiaca]|uniref:IS21 family transposase n=1 Tax=Brevundimonas aurantiaca TaxID=74316 RepID=UPI001D1983B5|nr:IS21 family transposase [Brevundimonas aurantiaca]MCC4295895.1 IS21 family transposase [Brevundimonas aurantiaca]